MTQGASLTEVTGLLAATYNTPEETIKCDVETCAEFLMERGLLQIDHTLALKIDFALPEGARPAWNAPVFEEYTDMWELIKLDPIHEVDEVGWPVRKT
jgi:hypothetical protein